MRSTTGLFMMLIGMISFTMSATTPTLEQKQEPSFTQGIIPYEIGNVALVTDFSFHTEVFYFDQGQSYLYRSLDLKNNTFATVLDVGWCQEWRPIFSTTYKEKLQSNFSIGHKLRISKIGIKQNRDNC
ncbi:hypothetical protein ACRASX_11025 [Flavobacterium sp. TMP13]|uniref:hypothetical protein n=1 Tax=unclassified Flavobacterium TaxID=196869 RepID=UPI00076DC7D0|nr:hypothetical protein [Flavobacterium sp. TAB 87]KVV16138.1 hypothetical protein AP058_00303 [Flavobacterium sp. TAB 87]